MLELSGKLGELGGLYGSLSIIDDVSFISRGSAAELILCESRKTCTVTFNLYFRSSVCSLSSSSRKRRNAFNLKAAEKIWEIVFFCRWKIVAKRAELNWKQWKARASIHQMNYHRSASERSVVSPAAFDTNLFRWVDFLPSSSRTRAARRETKSAIFTLDLAKARLK